MAMPADKDYLILNLRLAYLRKIDDRSGPRIITVPDIINAPSPPSTSTRLNLDANSSSVKREGTLSSKDRAQYNSQRAIDNILPAYRDDSQVVLAGLNDAQKHPELLWIYSPNASYEDLSLTNSNAEFPGQLRIDEEDPAEVQGKESSRARATSLGTGGLKHTTTIYGPGQTGALGMRVSGQRKLGSVSKRRRPAQSTSEPDAAHSDSAIGTSRATQDSAPSLSSDPSDASDPVRRDIRVPALAIQASTYETDGGVLLDPTDGQSGQADDPESSTAALLRNRGRSRSQPHRPSLPSGLSNVSTFQDADAAQDARPTQSVIAPPPRPPRKARQSISGQSTKSASAVPTSGSEIEGMDVEQSVEGRQRSQSEAIKPYKTLSDFSVSHGTSSGDASVSRFGDGRDQLISMDRTHSESTLFSLASARATRRRGLSNKSQQSDGSTPSLDMSMIGSGAERGQSFSFAPVAEHPEGNGLDDDHHTTFNEAYRDGDTQELLLASDAERIDGAPFRQDLLDPWDISSRRSTLTPFNINKDETRTSRPETISETSAPAPPLLEAGLESASLLPASSAALSSDVGTAQGARAGGKDIIPHSLNSSKSSSSPFLKENPMSVKKRFEERVTKSALTALISKRSEGPSNPFTQLYRGVAGSSVSNESSVVVEVLFPFALPSNPPPLSGKPRSGALALHPQARSMQLSVRKDAQMEELIGYSLYCYVEEDWMPRLEEALGPDASDDQREVRLSTLGWTLRLVEDGEVDDDYPALDRNLTVGKFGADELAICEATAAQIKQNQAASAGANKRPRKLISAVPANLRSTALAGKSAVSSTHRTPVANTSAAHTGANNSLQGSSLLSSTLAAVGGAGREASTTRKDTMGGSSTNDGDLFTSLVGKSIAGTKAPVFLRILVTPNQDVRYKTTLQVTSDRYLADVLETICKRRELGNADKWAFVVPDKDIVVPLDRTVESLQGNYDLALVKRQDLGAQHSGALTMQSTNPNASIFKHASRHERPLYGSGKDIASVYKSYTVNRRMPTFLARHERVLTIDGDWLHIIPTDTRAFQNQTATTSYPISSIVSCTQARLPSSFKLVVERESDQKRYDFEAENSKVAAEIVQEINKLMKRPS